MTTKNYVMFTQYINNRVLYGENPKTSFGFIIQLRIRNFL